MITDIHLQYFRSYEDASFEFGKGVNIIVGPNASGKTNLLESLLFLARGGSYRATDTDLISFDHEWMRLDAHIDGEQKRTVKFTAGPPPKKRYELEDKEYQRLTQDKQLPVVLFEPNHLQILQGPPEGRRAYLDDILEQISPGYPTFRKSYRRVLSQRNALLKRSATTPEEFFPWNLRLSELGALIHRKRTDLVGYLNSHAPALYKDLSESKTNIELQYMSKFSSDNYESQLLHQLEKNLAEEKLRGFTLYGPHREDMTVLFEGNDSSLVASRGETRTAVLVLKTLELEALREATAKNPILLLDDVFSELDGARRKALTSHMQRYQTFLTTTDADIAVKHFSDSTVIPLS